MKNKIFIIVAITSLLLGCEDLALNNTTDELKDEATPNNPGEKDGKLDYDNVEKQEYVIDLENEAESVKVVTAFTSGLSLLETDEIKSISAVTTSYVPIKKEDGAAGFEQHVSETSSDTGSSSSIQTIPGTMFLIVYKVLYKSGILEELSNFGVAPQDKGAKIFMPIPGPDSTDIAKTAVEMIQNTAFAEQLAEAADVAPNIVAGSLVGAADAIASTINLLGTDIDSTVRNQMLETVVNETGKAVKEYVDLKGGIDQARIDSNESVKESFAEKNKGIPFDIVNEVNKSLATKDEVTKISSAKIIANSMMKLAENSSNQAVQDILATYSADTALSKENKATTFGQHKTFMDENRESTENLKIYIAQKERKKDPAIGGWKGIEITDAQGFFENPKGVEKIAFDKLPPADQAIAKDLTLKRFDDLGMDAAYQAQCSASGFDIDANGTCQFDVDTYDPVAEAERQEQSALCNANEKGVFSKTSNATICLPRATADLNLCRYVNYSGNEAEGDNNSVNCRLADPNGHCDDASSHEGDLRREVSSTSQQYVCSVKIPASSHSNDDSTKTNYDSHSL